MLLLLHACCWPQITAVAGMQADSCCKVVATAGVEPVDATAAEPGVLKQPAGSGACELPRGPLTASRPTSWRPGTSGKQLQKLEAADADEGGACSTPVMQQQRKLVLRLGGVSTQQQQQQPDLLARLFGCFTVRGPPQE